MKCLTTFAFWAPIAAPVIGALIATTLSWQKDDANLKRAKSGRMPGGAKLKDIENDSLWPWDTLFLNLFIGYIAFDGSVLVLKTLLSVSEPNEVISMTNIFLGLHFALMLTFLRMKKTSWFWSSILGLAGFAMVFFENAMVQMCL